jgi:hypothetical protein
MRKTVLRLAALSLVALVLFAPTAGAQGKTMTVSIKDFAFLTRPTRPSRRVRPSRGSTTSTHSGEYSVPSFSLTCTQSEKS